MMKAPDRIDVARQALGEVLTHPATWGPFLPIAGAYAFLGAPWWVCLPLVLAVVAVVFLVWTRWWPQLTTKARTGLLSTHRAAEDAELTGQVLRLAQSTQRRPSREVLDALREAMEIKRAVENRLHADGVVTVQEEEVGALVGELVRTMVGEAERLALSETGEASRAAGERFQKAAATLRGVFAEIDVILDPIPEDLRLPAGDDPLLRASERLDERLKLARGIRRHLERDIRLPEPESIPEAAARDPLPPRQPPAVEN